jgi:hypothetical protein
VCFNDYLAEMDRTFNHSGFTSAQRLIYIDNGKKTSPSWIAKANVWL